jgi:hypothetical protein
LVKNPDNNKEARIKNSRELLAIAYKMRSAQLSCPAEFSSLKWATGEIGDGAALSRQILQAEAAIQDVSIYLY